MSSSVATLSTRWRWAGYGLALVALAAGSVFIVTRAWLPLAVGLWLTPLAVYDLRYKEVPNTGVVLLPLAAAAAGTAWSGNWALAALAGVVVAASERDRLPAALARRVLFFIAGAAAGGLLFLVWPDSLPGAFAILAFWLMYEMRWWAGADALVAITLALLWPDLRLVAALGLAHLLLAPLLRGPAALLRLGRPRVLTNSELDEVAVPGLPALALTAMLTGLWLILERM